MRHPRLLEALQGHLALTAAPASPSLPPHTPPLLWQKGWLLPVVGRGNCHMGLWLGDWTDTQYGRQMKVQIKPSMPGKNIYPPHLLASSARYLGTNVSALFH